MIGLILIAVGAAASVASSIIQANTDRKMAAVEAEIEALNQEAAQELKREIDQQRLLQTVIKTKNEEFLGLQKEKDQQASLHFVALVGVLFCTAYGAWLLLKPKPNQ